MANVTVVVGGQYGSEAKGHVTAKLTKHSLDNGRSPVVVRVAGPNAGHTAYSRDGKAFAFRQVPVGIVVDDPDATNNIVGIIAAGSEVDLPVLLDEIHKCRENNIPVRLLVDSEATLIWDEDKEAEDQHKLVKNIGSTGKGIGAARSARIMRQPGRRLGDDSAAVDSLINVGVIVTQDTAAVIATDYSSSWYDIIVEGTQGYGLGLRAGFYPQCTSSDCRAIDFLAMAGISPWATWIDETNVVVVARVYPIRVAGNSGPLKNETTWDDLGLPEERTTVTQKIRRVGLEDWDLVKQAVLANGGTDNSASNVSLAITMTDQKYPGIKNADSWQDIKSDLALLHWITEIEQQTGATVELITTGPDTAICF